MVLHKLAKETDRVTKVWSSDREIDKTTNKLSIVCWLTHCSVGVGIQFEVLIERGCHRFALGRPELVLQVEDVMS